MTRTILWTLSILSMIFMMTVASTAKDKPKVLLVTSLGEIQLELYPDKAPFGVQNFLTYVRNGFYDNTIFHRVMEGFMIQGGGFDQTYTKKETMEPVPYEGANGLKNYRGTIAYARTDDINSATSQFFINHSDNYGLNHGQQPDGNGYAVFGKVTKGMNVVDAIAKVKTGVSNLRMNINGRLYENPANNVPVNQIVLISATVIGEDKKADK